MPSVVGSANINSNSGTINFGDNLNISPKSNSKTVSGQGGGNVGNVVYTLNGVNTNTVSDPGGLEQVVSGTA
jgi:spore germination protein PF